MNNHYNIKLITVIAITVMSLISLQSQDKIHFYTTIPMWNEPRFEKKWLGSMDLSFFTGSADKGRTYDGCTTNLFDIYGKHNMHLLGENVPNKDLSKITDLTLTNLSLILSDNNFGKLSFSGSFEINQFDFTFIQNFKHGFFSLFHFPIKSFDINCIRYTDISPEEPNIPNKNNATWQTFLEQFDSILKQYSLDIKPYKKTSIGDTSLILGWTKNYQETKSIDFIDTTIKIGIILHTGRKKDIDKVFSLPHGYNGHFGIPLSFDLSVGLYEWLTIGGHIDSIFFINKTKSIRLKTAYEQSGLIKLAKATANIKPGTKTLTGLHLSADHFLLGLSCFFAYSFSYKSNDEIKPCNTKTFNYSIVNSDQIFKKWSRHTIHLKAEYDFTKENKTFCPRIGVFYNWDIKGKQTFKTNTGGITFGLDIVFEF